MSGALEEKFDARILSDFLIFVAVLCAEKPQVSEMIGLQNAHGADCLVRAACGGGAEKAGLRIVNEFVDFADGIAASEVGGIFLFLFVID